MLHVLNGAAGDLDGDGVDDLVAGDGFTAEYAGEISRWKDEWNRSRSDLQKRATERQIADERIINARIAYLLFDSSTVLSRESPFCYFIRDDAGWKITSYLDSSFHAELELALEHGEFSLRDW